MKSNKNLIFVFLFYIVFILLGCKSDSKVSGTNPVNQQSDIRISKTALVGDNIAISTANGEQQNPQVIYCF